MNRNVIKLILMLLAAMLPTAWAFASQKVAISVTGQGSIVADKMKAAEGELVTLTIAADNGWKLERSTLVVEQVTTTAGDSAQLTRSAALEVGAFVAVNRLSDSTYTFTMPATDVEVRATFVETTTSTTTIAVQVETGDTGTTTDVTVDITIDKESGDAEIGNVTLPDDLSNSTVAVTIPAVVTDTDGEEHPVTGVASGALMGQTNVTDIYLPDTDEPINIEEGAFLLDRETGDQHQVATIHTPLALLDDYALMTSLSENYAAGKVSATAKAIHRYWTFSCGVDVMLPEGVRLYIVKGSSANDVEII